MEPTTATPMTPPITQETQSTVNNSSIIRKTATQHQIRGSSLLLVGQFISRGVNFIVQILIVRYLTQASYGSFAYALSIVSLCQSIALFGLDRAITRFIPIYHEKKEFDKLFGTLFMVVGTIFSLSLVIALLFYVFQVEIARSLIKDQLSLSILLIMIFVVPFEAFDELLVGMLSIFASPSSIFFRKNVLAPGLKLAIVLLLVTLQHDVFFLSAGYLFASSFGVIIYTYLLIRVMRKQDLFSHFNLHTIQIPWFEVLSFTIPLLSSELVYTAMNSIDVILLDRYKGTVDIAAFRAVQPTAMLNQMVLTSFATLFTPLAARMFARKDREGINNLYWQTAIWIAVISFPIFALTFSHAKPITILFYGDRYQDSAIILSLLSFGYYFNAALGFNGLTLKVYGKLRYIVTLNILAAVANLAINLIMIPRYGALGAAIGTTTTLILHNILKQTGLRLGTGINLFERHYLKGYLVISLGAIGLLVVQKVTNAPVYLSVLLAGLASLLVIRLNRRLLDINQTFPELLRIPLLRQILRD